MHEWLVWVKQGLLGLCFLILDTEQSPDASGGRHVQN